MFFKRQEVLHFVVCCFFNHSEVEIVHRQQQRRKDLFDPEKLNLSYKRELGAIIPLNTVKGYFLSGGENAFTAESYQAGLFLFQLLQKG